MCIVPVLLVGANEVGAMWMPFDSTDRRMCTLSRPPFPRNTMRRGRRAGKVSRNGRGKGLDQFKEANGQYLEPSQILRMVKRRYISCDNHRFIC